MKKIFFSFLAIGALASCAKTDAVYEDVQSEIKLAPVAALQTKANVLAAIDGTEYPTAENFDVYGYWKNVGAGEIYTDGASYFGEEGVEFVNKGNYWGGAKTYYWPKNGALRFAAYSPADLDLAHEQVGDVFSVDGYVQPSNTAETWDFLVAPTSESYTAMTAAENVSIVFKHALSWITLKVKAKDAEAAEVFTIKNVTINDVNTTAYFEASMLDGIQNEEWKNLGTPVEYVVFDGEQGVTGEAAVIETTTAGTLVIPQATTNVTVVFDQKGVNGTLDMTNMEVTLDLVLDQDDEPWKPGYHYTYTLIFGLDEILINPSVEDWTEYVWNADGTQGEITTEEPVSNVATAEQLADALANGGKVVLQNNIELTETVTVPAGVTAVLDLNGKNIVNTPAGVATDVIIVKGELTINGEGSVEAADGTDGYTVISEGLLIINGGEYKAGADENGEANAVIYARGNGKVFVNGGTFPNDANSVYVLNKKDADRATTEISVAGGSFKNFNPGDNAAENPKESFLKDGYMAVANGEWFEVVKGEATAPAVLVKTIDELQAVLDAATEPTQVVFAADMVGNVTATQKGVDLVIDGNNYAFDGILTVNGKSRYDGAETLVIKNVNFATESTAAMDFISSSTDAVRYAHNVTIENCTFTAPEGTDVVAIRFRQAYDVVVKNCTVKGGHSLAQITSSNNIDFVGCNVESGRGINLQNALNGVANVINCNITATKYDGYGVRVDAKGANVLNVRGCAISAYEPIVLRNADAAYTANLSNNTLTLTNGGTEEIVVKGQTPVINK